MPQIIPRGRVWYSDIRIGGKRIRKPLSTDKSVAIQELSKLIAQKDANKHGHAPKIVEWDWFIKNKYLPYSRGAQSETTYNRNVAALSSLSRFRKPKNLTDVTTELLELWRSWRRQEGRGNATINRDVQVIKAVMARAREWGYVSSWDGRSVKKLRQARGRLLFYTPEEAARLIAICKSRFSAFYNWETICLLGLRAGLRRSEIFWLSWEDVDLKRGILSVVPKGGWQPKTGESRHIPISDDLKKHLSGLKRVNQWVLGERPSLAVMSAFFQKISRKAGLKGNIHTLRHTFASWLVQAGVDLYTVSKLMGHSDIKTTQIYAHLAPSNYIDAISKMPKL